MFSQFFVSDFGTRSEIAVMAPPQTCVRTGPVAHCAAMSGPDFAAAAAWNVAMNVSVACSTTLILTDGFFASYALTAFASHLLAPGASASPQNHMVRLVALAWPALALFAPALPTEKAAVSARAVTATAVTHVRLFRDDPPDGSRRMPTPRSRPAFTHTEIRWEAHMIAAA